MHDNVPVPLTCRAGLSIIKHINLYPVLIIGHTVEDIRGLGDNLDCRRVELSTNVTVARSRWTSNYHITPATGSSDQLERRCWNENQVPAEARPPDPQAPVEQHRRTGKKCWYGQKSGGQYVAVLLSLQLTSHKVKPFVTILNPFK